MSTYYSLDGERYLPGDLMEAIRANYLEAGDTVYVGEGSVPTGEDLIQMYALDDFIETLFHVNEEDWYLDSWQPIPTDELRAGFRDMLVKWFNENLAEDLPSTVRGTPVKVSTDEYLRANRDA